MSLDDLARESARLLNELPWEARGRCSYCHGPYIQGPFLDSAHICKEVTFQTAMTPLPFYQFKEDDA